MTKLKKYLSEKQIDVKMFAKILGCSYPHISEIMYGRREPGLFLAKAISNATEGKVMVDDLRSLKTKAKR